MSKSTNSRSKASKARKKGILDAVFNFDELKKPKTHDGLKKRIPQRSGFSSNYEGTAVSMLVFDRRPVKCVETVH